MDEEAVKLVSLWGEDEIQIQLEGCKRNRSIYNKIAQEMAVAGYDRSAIQCRDKLKELRADYKIIKDSNKETGRASRFYEKLDEILGHRPATRPDIILDTSAFEASEIIPEIAESTPEMDSAVTSDNEGEMQG